MMRSNHKAGYTLLELMIVVTLMGVMAMLAAPALGTWRNDVRHQDTAYKVLRDIQRTQELASLKGYAHALRLTPGTGDGQLVVAAGMARCLKTPWADAPIAEVGTTLGEINASSASRTLSLTASLGGAIGLTVASLCIEPTGSTYTSVGGAFTPQIDLLVFTIDGRDSSGNASGTPRVLVVEPGGRARNQR